VDRIAAAFILQDYLNKKARLKKEDSPGFADDNP
jgi:hypothetical protein